MYNQVGGLPATGVGVLASSGAAYTLGGFWWVFAALAVFTLVGAVGAFARTVPAMGFLYRRPKQLAPDGRPEGPSQPRRRR